MSIEEKIEDLLIYMEMAKGNFRQPRDAAFQQQLPLSHFSGAEPIMQDEVKLHEGDGCGLYNFFSGVTLGDLSGPLDCTLMSTIVEDGTERPKPDFKYALARYRSVSQKQLRGKTVGVYPQMIEWSLAAVYMDGSYGNDLSYAGWDGSTWRAVPRKHSLPPGATALGALGRGVGQQIRQPEAAISVQFTRRYTWRVLLGYSVDCTIAFPTDPVGAREVFRLRDIPEGRSRRAALKHWVGDHWRRSRSDPQEEMKIRLHLRGASAFHWNGLHCVVQPSEFDVEKLQELKGLPPERRVRAARALLKPQPLGL